MAPKAKIYVSVLWERFVPHLGAELKGKIIDIPDEGMDIDFIKAAPAHFMHSLGTTRKTKPFSTYIPVTFTSLSPSGPLV